MINIFANVTFSAPRIQFLAIEIARNRVIALEIYYVCYLCSFNFEKVVYVMIECIYEVCIN